MDVGSIGFRVAASALAALVAISAIGRMVLEAASIGYVARGWIPVMATLLTAAIIVRSGWPWWRYARGVAQTLSGAVLVLSVVFAFEHVAGVSFPALDGAPALWRSDLASLPYSGRPAPLSLLVIVMVAAAVWLLDRSSGWAVTTSALLLLLAGSYGITLLMALAFPGPLPVTDFFQSTAGAIMSSGLMLLGMVAASILARPYRLPLGPMLSTGMWPLVAFGIAMLLVATMVTQAVYHLSLDAAMTVAQATTLAFLLQASALILLLGFTVWYASLQQHRSAERAQQRAAANAFADVAYRAAVPMAILDSEGTVRGVNQAYTDLTGDHPDQVVGSPLELIDPSIDWWQKVLIDDDPHTERVPVTTAAGTRVWVDLTVSSTQMRPEREKLVLAQLVDVTEAKASHDELEFRVAHDPLTGLLTRDALASALTEAAGRTSTRMLVVTLGLDNFRGVNEVYGHRVGDQLLQAVARSVRNAAPYSARIGRLGGDEFALVTPADQSSAAADEAQRRFLDRLLSAVEQDYLIDGFIIRVSASAGSVIVPGPDAEVDQAFQLAATALAQAKRDGGHRWQPYDSNLRTRVRDDANTLTRLRTGLRNGGEIVTWFQPIVDLRTLKTVGYESLVRWIHPHHGVVPAGQWIELAETDLAVIHQIGLVTAQQASDFALTLPPHQRVSVNVSGAHMSSREFSDFADFLLELNRDQPNPLILELTETSLAQISGPGLSRLHQLVAGGLGLWADDFGTGYSSVAHLRDLPLTGLKLDKSFTAHLDDPTSSSGRIADALAGLASGLGLTTVAEGVETRAQAHRVAASGWELGQGWLFGRPGPRPDAAADTAPANRRG